MAEHDEDDAIILSPFAPPELIEEAKARKAARMAANPPTEVESEPAAEAVVEAPISITKEVVAEATVHVGLAEVVEIEPEPAPVSIVVPKPKTPVVATTRYVTEDGIELADAPLVIEAKVAPSSVAEPIQVIVPEVVKPATPSFEPPKPPSIPLDSENTVIATGSVRIQAEPPVELSAPPVTGVTPVVAPEPEVESEIISTREAIDPVAANESARVQTIRQEPISVIDYERREIRPEVTRVGAAGKSREKLWEENVKKQKRASSRVLVWVIVTAALLGSVAAIAFALITG